MADEARPLSEDRGGEVNELEEEVEKLEVEVKQMAQRILHYRTMLPDQFKKTVASVLAAQRPLFPNLDADAQPGVSGDCVSDAGERIESSKGALVAEEDPEIKEKIRLLKLKISSNVSAMPVILKRMNECISRIDRLDSFNETIHPAFKKKRTS